MKAFLATAIALLLIPPALAAADPSSPSDLSPTLAGFREKHHLPGVVGAIIHGDQIVAIGSAGLRKVGDPAPFLPGDIIHLGSDTKAMTAILIGQLIDQKQLAFDDTMDQLFPSLAAKMNPQMAKVTVRNLLTHDAGLPHDLDWWKLDSTHLPIVAQRRRAVREALSVPPTTPIGSNAYSNVGYVLLGAIIESKTGKPWEDVIRKNLFEPLHMTTAGFGPPGMIGKVEQPWGHVLQDGELKPVQIDNPPVMGPAGRVHCSVADWSKFIAETLKAARGHPTLVSAETYKQLITPISGQDYDGGWIVTDRDWAGGLALTHAGSNTTWYCSVWIAVNRNFAVLIAMNDGEPSVAEAADQGIGVLIDFNARLPSN